MNCQALRLAYLHQRRLIRRLQAELADVKAEEDNSYQLVARMGALLKGVVNALRGAPPPDTLWSYHDAPDRAQAAIDERNAAIELLREWGTSYDDPRYRGLPDYGMRIREFLESIEG